jgi:hypothetical protein
MMFASISDDFTNLRHVKTCKTCVLGQNALFRGYQSCEASILVHWTQNDVWECFRAFANLGYVKDAKLVFEPECTISGYQSYEAFILVHWSQNGVWECFRAFR